MNRGTALHEPLSVRITCNFRLQAWIVTDHDPGVRGNRKIQFQGRHTDRERFRKPG